MARPRWKKCALVMAHTVTALQVPHGVTRKMASSSHLLLSTTPNFSAGFDSHQMDALVLRGELEASLMLASQGLLEESKKKSSKKNKTTSVKSKAPSVAQATRTLKQDGVVRLNGVLSASTAATMRKEILERRAAAFSAIDGGDDWRQYFADVLLKSNRCDLLLPLKGSRAVQTALRELLLQGTLANVLLSTLGDDATLYELAAIVSEPGSPRQPVHPDNPYQEHPPLITCFVALQDIASSMGPTTFLPKTNTAAAHAEFDTVFQRDAMLQKRPSVVALLNAGDASLFDSRTMHCGGANNIHEGATRALFYVSFRNPRATQSIGNIGSKLSDIKPITLRELRTKLAKLSDDTVFDPFDEEQEEANTVREYILTAEQGNADSQFNLGLCYKLGRGVEKNDAEAVRWFRLAAERGGALAQCNLGFGYYLGEGVEKNEIEAVRWFGLAAAQGLAHAQHNLGVCFSSGVGVPRDLERAAELLRLAALQEHPGSIVAYDKVLEEMQSTAS